MNSNIDWINVTDSPYNADPTGINDSTTAFQNAIDAAINFGGGTPTGTGVGVIYIPAGTYRIDNTIDVCQREFQIYSPNTPTDPSTYGCIIIGANPQGFKSATSENSFVPRNGVVINSKINSNTTPVFKFRGSQAWQGQYATYGIKNITIQASSNNLYKGTGIELDGIAFCKFENLALNNLYYGVWMHTSQSGTWTEFNEFKDVLFQTCFNGIRFEQAGGDTSFHGNIFDKCIFNIDGVNKGSSSIGQTGLNIVKGDWYNARFDLFFFGLSNDSVYVNIGDPSNSSSDVAKCSGIGSITYESVINCYPQITSNGPSINLFRFDGFIRGVGTIPLSPPTNYSLPGLRDSTAVGFENKKVFACTNYWKKITYGTTAPGNTFTTGSLLSNNQESNVPAVGFFQRFSKPGVESVILNTYDSNSENGLYLGRVSSNENESAGVLGLLLSGNGEKIKSFNPATYGGLNIESETGFRVLFGKINIAGGNNSYRYGDAIQFSNFIAGRLILTTQQMDNLWAASSLYDIHWGFNVSNATAVSRSWGWNNSWDEYLEAQLDGVNRKLRVGTNNISNMTIWWHFIGVVL